GRSRSVEAAEPLLLHAHVLAQKRRHVEVLAFDDRRLAFLETAASHRFELHHFLFRLRLLLRDRLRFLEHRRLFSRENQAGLRRRWWFSAFRLLWQRRNRLLLDRFVRNHFLIFDQFGRDGSL